jgi:hypothetical protein
MSPEHPIVVRWSTPVRTRSMDQRGPQVRLVRAPLGADQKADQDLGRSTAAIGPDHADQAAEQFSITRHGSYPGAGLGRARGNSPQSGLSLFQRSDPQPFRSQP